jgi:hypothetical protein
MRVSRCWGRCQTKLQRRCEKQIIGVAPSRCTGVRARRASGERFSLSTKVIAVILFSGCNHVPTEVRTSGDHRLRGHAAVGVAHHRSNGLQASCDRAFGSVRKKCSSDFRQHTRTLIQGCNGTLTITERSRLCSQCVGNVGDRGARAVKSIGLTMERWTDGGRGGSQSGASHGSGYSEHAFASIRAVERACPWSEWTCP